ncbi:MAG: cytochrome c biogenesis protein CcdA/thioredoxin-related protein [Gammaproteobacteria bacterium]|jgi:cytochrome c biogenesis protein CcdA/thioredoxin-related protein
MRIFAIFFAALLAIGSQAQILTPAKWSNTISEKSPEVGDIITLSFKTEIEENWYVYSSDFDPDLGPIVTTFEFEPNDTYELVGELLPVNPSKGYDSLWEGEYTYFKKKGEFRQQVKVLKENYKISGIYIYQVCSDVDGKCIPFEDEFFFEFKNQKKQVAELSKEISVFDQRSSTDPYSLLSFMLVAFLAGMAALLTPCVFPMIPMTVTFFTGKSGNKKGRITNSLFYGISIILIYVLIGAVLAPFMGPETANDLATGWIPNIIFFTVFVLFALSFFGLFEITLPHKWVNGVDQLGDKGGFVGIFFMALTLVLVSFSCTGPLVGSLLVESAGGQILKPILGMFAFSAAFAIPFTLFALFPGWLKALPKSGGWLNSVKVVLGFLELALAFKFLSIADQAYHWHILDREIYLAIWIVIFSFLGLYLLNKIKLSGDTDETRVSVPRLVLAIITFTFVTYLIPGMFGAPLKALSGYLPPISTHDFNLMEVNRYTMANSVEYASEECEPPKYEDILHWPHGLNGYFDYAQAMACAKAVNKPLFIDFTGHGCVNCREMEQRVWSDPKVIKRLSENFVLLALYVDDKTELEEDSWYTSEYDGKVKKTIGKQNADLQITSFNNNAQPFYVILDHNEDLLLAPKAYDLNVNNFVKFLDAASKNF